MDGIHCSHCAGRELEPGFLEDVGSVSPGAVRWIRGELRTGFFGWARQRYNRTRMRVDAYRCTGCSHLELFVAPPPAPEATAPSSEPS